MNASSNRPSLPDLSGDLLYLGENFRAAVTRYAMRAVDEALAAAPVAQPPATSEAVPARDLAELVLHMDMVTEKGKRARELARQVLAREDDAVRYLRLIEHATSPEHDDGAHHEAAHDLATAGLAALATQPPAPVLQTEGSDLLAGWSITDACQAVDEDGEIVSGVWELGARDGDGNFCAIATVDTDNYDQPEAAEPLARAILARLATPPALPPVAVPDQTDFSLWVVRAYRDAFAPDQTFSIHNMRVAFTAGMNREAIRQTSLATTAAPVVRVTAEMVDRFLSWRLPPDFAPDCGISFKRVYNETSPFGPQNHEPVGTNLLTADQARAMLEHVIGPRVEPLSERTIIHLANKLPGVGECISGVAAIAFTRAIEASTGEQSHG